MCHSCNGTVNTHGFCEECGFDEMQFINEWEEQNPVDWSEQEKEAA
jgi:hypothetical protein